MDNKERFDQIEGLLTELLRRSDRQDEFNKYATQQFERIDQRFERIDQRLDYLTGQLNGVIEVLKLSAEAQKQNEERHEQLLKEIREQGRRTDVTQTEILRMMQKWDEQETQNQSIEERLAAMASHEPRIKRLEDDTLRAAS